eukprot:432632_1
MSIMKQALSFFFSENDRPQSANNSQSDSNGFGVFPPGGAEPSAPPEGDEPRSDGDTHSMLTLPEAARLSSGDFLDVRDKCGKWLPAQVKMVSIDKRRLFIHYENWDEKWDEWIETCAVDRMARFTTKSIRGEGAQNPYHVGDIVDVCPPARAPRASSNKRWTQGRVIRVDGMQVEVDYSRGNAPPEGPSHLSFWFHCADQSALAAFGTRAQHQPYGNVHRPASVAPQIQPGSSAGTNSLSPNIITSPSQTQPSNSQPGQSIKPPSVHLNRTQFKVGQKLKYFRSTESEVFQVVELAVITNSMAKIQTRTGSQWVPFANLRSLTLADYPQSQPDSVISRGNVTQTNNSTSKPAESAPFPRTTEKRKIVRGRRTKPSQPGASLPSPHVYPVLDRSKRPREESKPMNLDVASSSSSSTCEELTEVASQKASAVSRDQASPKSATQAADMTALSALFRHIGVDESYVDQFCVQKVTVKDISELSEPDLVALMPHVGPRSRLRKYIDEEKRKKKPIKCRKCKIYIDDCIRAKEQAGKALTDLDEARRQTQRHQTERDQAIREKKIFEVERNQARREKRRLEAELDKVAAPERAAKRRRL